MAKKITKKAHLRALETAHLEYKEHIGGTAAVDLFILKLADAMNRVAKTYPDYAAKLLEGVEMSPKERRRMVGKRGDVFRKDKRITFIGFLNEALIAMRGDKTPRWGYFTGFGGEPIPKFIPAIPADAAITFDNGITPPSEGMKVKCLCRHSELRLDKKPAGAHWHPTVIVPAKPKRKR